MFIARKDIPGEGRFLLVVNSLVVEEEQPYEAAPFDAPALQERDGSFTMCSHCRRTRVPGAGDNRVGVPDLVRGMPAAVTHGICSVCFVLHYGVHPGAMDCNAVTLRRSPSRPAM